MRTRRTVGSSYAPASCSSQSGSGTASSSMNARTSPAAIRTPTFRESSAFRSLVASRRWADPSAASSETGQLDRIVLASVFTHLRRRPLPREPARRSRPGVYAAPTLGQDARHTPNPPTCASEQVPDSHWIARENLGGAGLPADRDDHDAAEPLGIASYSASSSLSVLASPRRPPRTGGTSAGQARRACAGGFRTGRGCSPASSAPTSASRSPRVIPTGSSSRSTTSAAAAPSSTCRGCARRGVRFVHGDVRDREDIARRREPSTR